MVITILIFGITIGLVECTVDVNLPEMKYLADHLKTEECKRLVAALHFKSYDKPNALDAAEGKISEDLPCLNLLLHWNSSEGEGKGETHEIIFRRLRQIGRDDLADWISKTVYHELGNDLNKALSEPFPNLDSDDEESTTLNCGQKMKKPKAEIDEFPGDKIITPKIHHKFSYDNDPFPQDIDDDFPVLKSKKGRIDSGNFPEQDVNANEIKVDWLPIDTVCWIVILLLILITIFIVYRAIKASRNVGNGNNPQNSKYEKMTQEDDDDPAMKLMGVKSQN